MQLTLFPVEPRLSKSKYISGLQCHKRLYLEIHSPDLAAAPDAERQAVLEAGTDVGEVARRRFPGGVLVDCGHGNLRMALRRTEGRNGVPVRPALAGAVVGVLGIAAAITVEAGLRDAVAHPERAGVAWDATVLPSEDARTLDELVEVVAAVPILQRLLIQLKADLPEDTREAMAYAFREMLNNAIEHGGKLDPTKSVEVLCVRMKHAIIYWIKDPGEGFDPAKLEHAAVNNPVGDPFRHVGIRDEKGLRAGGFGILMTDQLVDELVYNEQRNELMFVKYL